MKGPHIDWAAISPLVALTVGACVVLLGGLLRAGFVRRALVPGATVLTLGIAVGLGMWQWGENTTRVAGAIAIDDLTLAMLMIFAVAATAAVMLSARSLAAAEAGHGEYHALLLVAVLGMVVLAGADQPRHAVHRLRAAVDPALRAVRDRAAARALARVGPQVPDHRLARLGGAALRARAALRRDGLDGLRQDRGGRRRRARRPAVLDLARADRHRPRLQGVGRAVPPVDAGRL